MTDAAANKKASEMDTELNYAQVWRIILAFAIILAVAFFALGVNDTTHRLMLAPIAILTSIWVMVRVVD